MGMRALPKALFLLPVEIYSSAPAERSGAGAWELLPPRSIQSGVALRLPPSPKELTCICDALPARLYFWLPSGCPGIL